MLAACLVIIFKTKLRVAWAVVDNSTFYLLNNLETISFCANQIINGLKHFMCVITLIKYHIKFVLYLTPENNNQRLFYINTESN